MAEPKVTNVVKLYTVLLLSSGPKHGYEIIKEVGERLGRKASPGQIYPFLGLLESGGYLKQKAVGKREKKVYTLTPKGRDFVDSLLSRLGNLVDIAIEPRLTECAHCGCSVYKGGFTKTIKGARLAFCCEYCAKSFRK